MAHKAQTKVSSRRAMTMFVVKGEQVGALAGFKLPADADVAIVSSRPESVRKIRSSVAKRLGQVREIVTRDPFPAREKLRSELINKAAFEPDARSRALLEGIRIAQDDLREAGGAYDLDQVRTLLKGVSRQAIDKRVREGSLLAVPGPSNRRSYPTVQFDRDGSVAPGLKAVRDALPTRNPWAILNFLVQPDDRLGGRKPVDVLKAGDITIVIEAARRYGEQGA
jgi:hypothetical protein